MIALMLLFHFKFKLINYFYKIFNVLIMNNYINNYNSNNKLNNINNYKKNKNN